MMKKACLFFLCSLSFLAASGTTQRDLDSVKHVLQTTKDKIQRLDCLYTLSFEYGLIEPQKGLFYGRKCLQEAKALNNLAYQLNAYNGLGNAYETLSRFDSARHCHRKSYEAAVKMHSPVKMALTLSNIAICNKELGEYKKALGNYLEAYKILERQKVYNPRVHVGIAEMYLRLGNHKEAEHHSRLGIRKCREAGHSYVIYNEYINLARCQLHKNQVDSAIINLEFALDGLLKNTDEMSMAICYNELGNACMANKQYSKAVSSFSKALEIYTRLKNINGCLQAGINAANALAHAGKRDLLLINGMLEKAEEIMPCNRNNDVLLDAYQKAAETHELLGNTAKALRYYKLGFTLKDSLLSKDRINQILELQSKYETQKKELEISRLKQSGLLKSIEIQDKDQTIQKRNTLLAGGSIVFFLLACLVYFFIQKQRMKMQYEKQLAIKATEEKERLRLAKDIHDDLGSGLSKISFLSELSVQHKTLDEGARENLASISDTSKKLVVNMRDMIWALNPENTTLSGLVARLHEYSADYLEDLTASVQLNFPREVPGFEISKESHREILMVLKESLNNIVKHSKATKVQIDTVIDADGFMLSVRDNGLGIDQNKKPGNGLGNMRSRITAIGGAFVLEGGPGSGTCITISMKLDQMKDHTLVVKK